MLAAERSVGAQARALARAVIGLVIEERQAGKFLRAYELRHHRSGLHSHPALREETIDALAREALLLAAARTEQLLPVCLSRWFPGRDRPRAVSEFRQAFLAYLAGALGWDRHERERFLSDLALYLRIGARERRRRRSAARSPSAFVDRCAFLLDPSLMEQACRAAVRFQREIERCTEQAVRAVFGRGALSAPAGKGRGSGRRRP